MRKLPAIFVLSVFLLASATGLSKDPRHPLSQIHPIDEDLNMSNRKIYNISEIEMRNGIQIDGFGFRDRDRNVNVLEWNSTGEEWEFMRGDVDLNGNKLKGVGSTQCPDGYILMGDGTCQEGDEYLQNLSNVLSYGNSAGEHDINLSGQDLENVNRIANGSEQVKFGSKIDMAGRNIINPGTVDGVDLDNPGNAVNISGNQYVVGESSIANYELDNTDRLNINGIELTGSMNATGNTIHYVGPPQHEFDAVNKSYVDWSDDTIADDQTLEDVLKHGNSAGPYSIDMNQQSLKKLQELQFADTNTDSGRFNMTETGGDLQVQYNSNQRLNVLKSGGIGVKNGGIEMTDAQRITWSGGFNVFADSTSNGVFSLPSGGHLRVYDPVHDNKMAQIASGGPITFQNSVTGNDILRMNASGGSNVEIPNGNMDISSGEIYVSSSNEPQISASSGTAGVRYQWEDETDSDTFSMLFERSSDVLRLQANRNEIINFNQDQTVNIPNGNLDVSGNRIVNVPAPQDPGDAVNKSYVDTTGDQATQTLSEVLSEGNSAGSYNIDMNNQEIQNFFSNACSDPNEVVKRVHSDGSYTCERVPEDVGAENLSETLSAGNIANRSIRMRGNDLVQVGQLETGGQNIQIRDTTNDQDIARFQEGGNMVVPSGNLDVSSGGITSNGYIEISGLNPPMFIADSTDTSADRRVFSMEEKGTEQWAIIHGVSNDDSFRIADRTSGTTNVIRAELGGNVEIPNGNLQMNNNTITDVSAPSDAYDAVNKKYVDESDDTIADDQALDQVLAQGNSTGSYDIDMNGNDIETGGGTVDVYDTSNQQNIARFNEGGNVEVPSGDLKMSGNNIDNVNSIDGGGNDIGVGDHMEINGNEIQNAGKVGVGTSSPNENLDVDGTASVSNSGTTMEVDSNGNVVVTLGS